MKYNYCPKCDMAYVKSRLERDVCIYCGSRCDTVDVRKNGLYYLGYGAMMAGAICALLPNYTNVSNPEFYMPIGLAMVVAGAAAVLMGNGSMKRTAREMALKERDDGQEAQ